LFPFSIEVSIVPAFAAKYVAFVLLMALASVSAGQQAQKHGVEKPAKGSGGTHHVAARDSAFRTGEAPAPTSAVQQQIAPRLISLDEGMAIIGEALEIRYRRHPREDCSHLVHDIYKRAGFAYSYADSSDLYEGVDGFRQVSHPQPGDLAVWKGHAAIVVNPAQHTFFSSTRTGLRVESYDLKYWKRRGTPRFFRYVTSAAPSLPSVIRTADDSN
jgi:cell wall-associated NlpC family hydrolase